MCKFKENCPCYDEDYCRNKTTSDEKCTATLIIKVNGNRYIKGDSGAEKPEQHVKELTAMQDVINARNERIAELQGQVDELIKTNENYKEYIASEVKTHGETEHQLEQCKDLIKAIKYMCKIGG